MVPFDGDEPRARPQDGAGKAAWARTDFEGRLVLQIARDGGNTVQQLLIQQEVLPQRLAGLQTVRSDYLAQRRQAWPGLRPHASAETGLLPPPS